MKFKEGVDITGITKECINGIVKADYVMFIEFDQELIVTSVCDGNHMKGSKHYEGNAFDMRTWLRNGDQMTMNTKNALAIDLSIELGSKYDVVVEATHIHIEYDPS